ncbi:MAG: type II CAAX endopeptidase family protein [Hespellia sp.]|nr:type II CAAX endopeptidase family protein [Hespellia sp.]
MQKTYKKLKIWQGLILLFLSILEIFWISGYFSMAAGLYGTLASEVLLLGMALLTVLLAKADFSEVFPIKQISVAGVGGTALLWLGAFMIMMIVDLIIMAFFPEEMSSVSAGLGAAFQSVPFQISFFIVAITPAICEEAVFRGVILHSLNPERYKWLSIILTGLIFGACHGSVWRFFPTALLGIMMGYILVETGNMIYNGIFHCINNAVPLILMFMTQSAVTSETSELLSSGAVWMSVGAYCIFGAVIPFSLYIGNYLIHYKKPGYRTTLFPEGRHWIIGVLIVLTVAMVFMGIVIMVLAVLLQPDMVQQIIEQSGV